VAGAKAVITNDTMAAHLGVSCNRPTLIIANGVNHARFTEYEGAGIAGVATVYPDFFNRRRQRFGDIRLNYEDVVTADIHSIEARTVVDRLAQLLAAQASSTVKTPSA
jgi:ADP-heptose:LPS heptosyltransferase